MLMLGRGREVAVPLRIITDAPVLKLVLMVKVAFLLPSVLGANAMA